MAPGKLQEGIVEGTWTPWAPPKVTSGSKVEIARDSTMSRYIKLTLAVTAAVLLAAVVFVLLIWGSHCDRPMRLRSSSEVERLAERETLSLPSPEVGVEGAADLREVVWIRGVVLDAYGLPVTDAVARVSLDGGGQPADGPSERVEKKAKVIPPGFAVQVPKGGPFVVTIESPSWGLVTLDPMTATQDVDLKISFRAEASISGSFEGEDKEMKRFEDGPQWVFLEGPLNVSHMMPPRVALSLSPEELTFQQGGLGPGSYRIVGNYKGRVFKHAFDIPRNGEKYDVAVQIHALEEGIFAGRALLEGTLKPLRNGKLFGHMLVFGTSTSLPGMIETDSDGYFKFSSRNLTTGVKIVFFRSWDYPETEVQFGDVDDHGIHLVVFPDPPPRMVLVLNRFGEAIPFVGVQFLRHEEDRAAKVSPGRVFYEKRAGENGEAPIMDIPPGRYRVTLELNTGRLDLAKPVQIPKDPEEDRVIIETELDSFLYLTALKRDGSPAHRFAAYARVYQEEGSQPTLVSLNPLTRSGLPTVVGGIDGRLGLGLRQAFRVEIFVISSVLGFQRLDLDSAWLTANDHVVARFDERPQYAEVQVVTRAGQPLEEVEFKIPFVTDAALEEHKARRDWGEVEGTPFLEVRKLSPGVFHLRLYPGEGSQVELSSSEHGATIVDTKDLLEQGRVVMPR